MNIKKDEYEFAMLLAFSEGMLAGYGIEHENITEEEENVIKEYALKNGFKRTSLNN